ncbi:hypothetical protein QLQ15_11585 [Lysobacter sp. LF1]|uniref:Lipoprotein n=1 Tax=Lysobacter stagni TaxID=3045172 RepID=A0ABT6XHB5_9GAMM|nr:hypothetical protein [Lysobacter sp. LF1]MDI9239545.1 hypothetical protein [Lysobacter sp. LF1]
MYPRSMAVAVLVAGMACVTGCAPKAPQGSDADSERQALVQRAQAFKRDAASTPALTPARKTELQQLASDVRAWQARTKREDVHVTRDSLTTKRINDSGGGGGCESCPGYRLDGDRICFLEEEGECPVDDGSDLQLGRVCVYSCIWIGAEAEPARKAP